MSKPQDYEVVNMMIKRGGSFVSALGRAAQLADLENLRIIKESWPEMWAKYTELFVSERRMKKGDFDLDSLPRPKMPPAPLSLDKNKKVGNS